MSDKSPATVDPLIALPDQAVITLHGRDAIAFSQAQFMNDVGALADGEWHWSGWLTPKGRVITLFALLRRDPETLWLVLPDGGAEAIVQRLRGYLFRSKVRIGIDEGRKVGGRFAEASRARGNAFDDDGGSVELDLGTGEHPRSLLIRGELDAAGDDDAVARWRVADLQDGLPRLVDTEREQWTPQQLSLERLQAFSVKKGCYPGQEIVARTHFLGKAKRGLALLASGSPIAVGSDVTADGNSLGRVMSVASASDEHVALAVLPLERPQAALRVDGADVVEAPLRGGLAR
ncbi:folate-binding protein YgfZ [Lysobacter sp. A03]|uniref:CAF17-like 4Fe-4S cluster assembly/insertion protein YgfZ n=1 Tax=Lysobacter sp. A03 TaxID=1199154 RepID=UPI0005B7443E|nr:folate-binding protein YgfZ [Lysobacter sp. A03]KIQ98420.1 Folate-dependent protein for Fe/S cluster synthesis/repair in oxidative stress [Lysobacter sp. A03]